MQLLDSPIPPLTAAALRMIICKRPAPPDHHLQEAGPSGWPSARGRSLWIIICKRPTTPDDHLQEAGPSRSSFARGRPFRMTICKRPVPLDHHLQEAGPPFWQPRQGRENCIFETLYNEKRCVLSVKESNINEKKSKFSHLLTVRAEVADPLPPPLTVSLTIKYPFFYRLPLPVAK